MVSLSHTMESRLEGARLEGQGPEKRPLRVTPALGHPTGNTEG